MSDNFNYWRQRCKVVREARGDDFTKYFFRSCTERKRFKNIHLLHSDTGDPVRDPKHIQCLIRNFYGTLYGAGDVGTSSSRQDIIQEFLNDFNITLTDEHVACLNALFTNTEVKDTFFAMDGLKSPGPDGIPAVFFHMYWGIVGEEVFLSVSRPVWARLWPFQNAFVSGSSIVDAALVAHEVLETIRTNRTGPQYAAFKVDLSKAYDRVKWDFVEHILIKLQFPTRWVSLIMDCICSVSYSVLVNEIPSSPFKPRSGLRQGNPLSPYVFTLCMETLSQALIRRSERGEVPELRVSRGAPLINHLFYADDALFFTRLNATACTNLRGVLDKFCVASGEEINMQKSFFVTSKWVSSPEKAIIRETFTFTEADTIGRYLGTPITFEGSKAAHFGFLLDNIQKHIDGWKVDALGPAGRLVLIAAILSAVGTHVMSIFQLPQKIINSINSMLTRFFWRSCPTKRPVQWIPNEVLQLPKCMGGLGIREAGKFNKALLVSRAWRLHNNPQLLLSKIYKARYGSHSPILQATCPPNLSRQSWGHRGLLGAAWSLQNGFSWRIRSGQQVRIGRDNWNKLGTLEFKTDSIKATWEDRHVVELMDGYPTQWNQPLIRSLFKYKSARAIIASSIRFSEEDDLLLWSNTKTGQYTAKSGYAYINCHAQAAPNANLSAQWWKTMWALLIPSRWKLIIWKIIHNGLPLGANRQRRMFGAPFTCPFCGFELETVAHVFRDCNVTRRIWRGCQLGLQVDNDTIIPITSWLSNWISFLVPKGLADYFVLVCWQIWKHRNECVFQGRTPNPAFVMTQIHQSYQTLPAIQDIIGLSRRTVQEHHPPSQQYTWGTMDREARQHVFLDGSWAKNTKTGLGIVLYVDDQRLLQAAIPCNTESAFMAELIALEESIQLAASIGLMSPTFHTDCITLVSLFNNTCQVPAEAQLIFRRCQSKIPSFRGLCICKVPREVVKEAHQLCELRTPMFVTWTMLFLFVINN